MIGPKTNLRSVTPIHYPVTLLYYDLGICSPGDEDTFYEIGPESYPVDDNEDEWIVVYECPNRASIYQLIANTCQKIQDVIVGNCLTSKSLDDATKDINKAIDFISFLKKVISIPLV